MTWYVATAEVLPMTNEDPVLPAREEAAVPPRDLEWRTRCDGVVAVAHVEGKAVAGISGPWSGKFALTWWERPLPARQLELYDTLDAAKAEVETWAARMRSGVHATATAAKLAVSTPRPATPASSGTAASKNGLLDQVRGLLPSLGRKRDRAEVLGAERLRQLHAIDAHLADDLHFAAND